MEENGLVSPDLCCQSYMPKVLYYKEASKFTTVKGKVDQVSFKQNIKGELYNAQRWKDKVGTDHIQNADYDSTQF